MLLGRDCGDAARVQQSWTCDHCMEDSLKRIWTVNEGDCLVDRMYQYSKLSSGWQRIAGRSPARCSALTSINLPVPSTSLPSPGGSSPLMRQHRWTGSQSEKVDLQEQVQGSGSRPADSLIGSRGKRRSRSPRTGGSSPLMLQRLSKRVKRDDQGRSWSRPKTTALTAYGTGMALIKYFRTTAYLRNSTCSLRLVALR